MSTVTIEVFGDKIECREFFDIVGTSTDISGIELFRNGKRLGQMIGISIPDTQDKNAMNDFIDKVEEWLMDNEY